MLADYLTPQEVSAQLDRSYMSVMRMLRAKKIKGEKKGWGWLIPKEEVDRIRKELEIAP